jgi:hypothetical protein
MPDTTIVTEIMMTEEGRIAIEEDRRIETIIAVTTKTIEVGGGGLVRRRDLPVEIATVDRITMLRRNTTGDIGEKTVVIVKTAVGARGAQVEAEVESQDEVGATVPIAEIGKIDPLIVAVAKMAIIETTANREPRNIVPADGIVMTTTSLKKGAAKRRKIRWKRPKKKEQKRSETTKQVRKVLQRVLGKTKGPRRNAIDRRGKAAVPATTTTTIATIIITQKGAGIEAKVQTVPKTLRLVLLRVGVGGIQTDTAPGKEIAEAAPRARVSTTATRIERESPTKTPRRSVGGRRTSRKGMGMETDCPIPWTRSKKKTTPIRTLLFYRKIFYPASQK